VVPVGGGSAGGAWAAVGGSGRAASPASCRWRAAASPARWWPGCPPKIGNLLLISFQKY